jgi:hypothetical protein
VRPGRDREGRLLPGICLLLLMVAGGASLPKPAAGDELPEPLRRALAGLDVPTDGVSLLMRRVGGTEPILSHLPEVPRNPASVMKLVTTWSALELLGPAYTWRTEVYFGGDFDGTTLHGDLGLKGYGDPFLVAEQFWSLLRGLQRLGLREIDGDLLLDDSYFDIPLEDPGVFDGQPYRTYNVGPSALLVNFKAVQFFFLADQANRRVHVSTNPEIGNLALVRQWFQSVYFDWMTNPRFRFLFDDCPVPGGSHHQKFVVVDGIHAFVGGMDVCESRWDDRRHRGENPVRVARGLAQKPYHDVQAYLAGREATGALVDHFWERWGCAGGGDRPSLPSGSRPAIRPRGLLPFGAARVALSRTQPSADGEGVREVESLFVDAIAAARRLIYVETQYFSSQRVRDALIERMARADLPRLEIVVLVNERAEALKEEVAVGLRQAQNLEFLRDAAAASGHHLGLYYTVCDCPTETFRNTYLHSKLLAVDDRFLTVGSANLTNRSMGIDSELHVSWEAVGDDRVVRRIARAIRRVRVSLLAEHGGLSGRTIVRSLARIEGLIGRLDSLAAVAGARLQRHGPPTAGQVVAMEAVDPESLPFDPETSAGPHDEPVDEVLANLLTPLSETFTALRTQLLSPRG